MKTSHRMLLILLLFCGSVLLLAVCARWVISTRNRDETANKSERQEPPPEVAAPAYVRWGLPEGATARLGKGEITDIKFSPDGSRFAVATSIGIWLYDAQTGTELALLTGHQKRVSAIAFSPDGSTLASGEEGLELRIWHVEPGHVETGELLETIPGAGRVESLAFSNAGTKLTLALHNWKLREWEKGKGARKTVPLKRDKKPLEALMELSPDASVLATAAPGFYRRNRRFPIQVWDTRSGNLTSNLTEHTSWIRSLAFSPDGKTLASGDESKTIFLWDVKGGDRLATFKLPAGGGHHALAFSPNGNFLASGSLNGTIYLWNATKTEEKWWDAVGQYMPSLVINGHNAKVTNLAFSPDGKTLISGSQDGTVRAWDTLTGSQQFTCSEFMGPIEGIVFSQDGRTVTSVNRPGWSAVSIIQHRHWDTRTGSHLSMRDIKILEAEAISSDGTTLAAEDRNRTFHLWNLHRDRSEAALASVHPKNDLNVKFAFSPNGNILASGDKTGRLRLWEVPHRPKSAIKRFFPDTAAKIEPHITLKAHAGRVITLAFSPDGKTVASSGGDSKVCLWNVDTGNAIRTLTQHQHPVLSLAFSPDNKMLASASERQCYVWDVATGDRISVLKQEQHKTAGVLVFSPDSSILVSGTRHGILQFWNPQTGHLLSTQTGHTRWLRSLVFSPDGKTLASGSSDGTILLWDFEKIIHLENHEQL